VTVHHVWIQADGATTIPSILSELCMLALRSWQPMRQIVWAFAPVAVGITGVSVRHAGHLMPPAQVAFWIANGVPVQMIKDVLSMRAIAREGGLFADLDVMWLGRPLSIAPSGYLIPVEPHSRSTGKVFGRAERYPTLALFAMPKGSDLASQLDRMFTQRWHTHACEFAKSKDPVPVNESSKKWMANTRDFKDAIKGNPEYMEYRPPISCMPWSIFEPGQVQSLCGQ
jgi:hypothetical protein